MIAELLTFGLLAFSLPAKPDIPYYHRGVASWYGNGNYHGSITANGERFDPSEHTCAHRTLPFDTEVLVRNLRSGASVYCRINDRGPYNVDNAGTASEEIRTDLPPSKTDRILDLSKGAARDIGLIEEGVGRVEIIVLGDVDFLNRKK